MSTRRVNTASQLTSDSSNTPRTAVVANDTASDAPEDISLRWTLTPEARARLRGQAIALPATGVGRLPALADKRVEWMGGVAVTAWCDRALIARTSLRGIKLSESDLDEFGLRVAFARECLSGEAIRDVQDEALSQLTQAKREPELSALSTASLRASMRACRVVLCDALGAHLDAGSDARRDVLAARADRTAGGHGKHNALVLGVFNGEPQLVEWLRSLPKNEFASLERLETLERERARRAALPGAKQDDDTPADLPERAFALAEAALKDVLHIGRYLVRGVVERNGDYAGFKAPSKPARKAETKEQKRTDEKKPPVVG